MTLGDDKKNFTKSIHELKASLDKIKTGIKARSETIVTFRQKERAISESIGDGGNSHSDMFLTVRRTLRRMRSRPNTDICTNRELKNMSHWNEMGRSRLIPALEICHNPLVPIAQLPYEILEEIFVYSLPSDFPEPSQSQAPISLTRVCRRWRALALALPILWSSMSTTSDWPFRVFSPSQVSLNDPRLDQILRGSSFVTARSNQPAVWIYKAKGLPFHMEIIIPMSDIWFGPLDPYKTWVLQTSDRWSHLRIHAVSSKMAVLLTGPLHKIKTLELVGMYKGNYDVSMSYTCRADFDLEPSKFCFPWVSLTTLDASKAWIIVDQLLVTLTGCPNLKTCRAKIQDLYTVGRLPYVTLNTLQTTLLSLELESSGDYPFKRLVDSLTTPFLVTLRCINRERYYQNRWPHSSILDFAKRSRCPLQTIFVRKLWVDKESAIDSAREVLSAFPTLKDIDFEP